MTKIQDIKEESVAVIVRSDSLITPATLEKETETRKLIKSYIAKNLTPGADYAKLHIVSKKECPYGAKCKDKYHFSKDTLLKPGAEKFMSLFHLRAEFEKDEDTWNMLGQKEGFLCYVCKLYTKSGQLVGEGRGARDVQKDYGEINKSIKMAQKSAMTDAILRTGALSDFFTQDLDTMAEDTKTLPEVQLEAEDKFTLNLRKESIMKLLTAIFKLRPVDKADIEKKVKDLTDLDLEESNYMEIVNRLRVVYDEGKKIQGELKKK